MRFAGATHQFLGDVLPSDFRAEIFSLVEAAWPKVPSPHNAWLEPRITGLLQRAMIIEQESRYETDPPFHISEDVKKRDPKTGKEKERTDVEIHLRHHYIMGQKPYFVFGLASKKRTVKTSHLVSCLRFRSQLANCSQAHCGRAGDYKTLRCNRRFGCAPGRGCERGRDKPAPV